MEARHEVRRSCGWSSGIRLATRILICYCYSNKGEWLCPAIGLVAALVVAPQPGGSRVTLGLLGTIWPRLASIAWPHRTKRGFIMIACRCERCLSFHMDHPEMNPVFITSPANPATKTQTRGLGMFLHFTNQGIACYMYWSLGDRPFGLLPIHSIFVHHTYK